MTSGYWVSRKASLPWISPLLLTAPSYDVSPPPRRWGSPRRSAHPQTRCIFTPLDFLPPLPRRSAIGFFNPAMPTEIFPHCSLHIWPHMASRRQSQLRRRLAHSQFSAMATIIFSKTVGNVVPVFVVWPNQLSRKFSVRHNQRHANTHI